MVDGLNTPKNLDSSNYSGLLNSWGGDEMAWLRLTTERAQTTLVNTDQITEICQNRSGCGCKIWGQGSLFDVRESVDEIATMIADAERRDRVDGIFRAIVYNFPQGYDPAEIWKTAETMLAKWNEKQEI